VKVTIEAKGAWAERDDLHGTAEFWFDKALRDFAGMYDLDNQKQRGAQKIIAAPLTSAYLQVASTRR